MFYEYRFLGWLLELLVEALSFSIVAAAMVHASQMITMWDVAAVAIEIFVVFCISGYALTTLFGRLLLNGKWKRAYPVLAALLFLTHFEIMNLWVPGGLMNSHNRTVFRAIGFAVVFSLTAVISLLLEYLERQGSPVSS